MTVNAVRRRTRKRRRLVEIIDHARRLDVIFPALEDHDEQYLRLIMLIWVVAEDGKVNMHDRRQLAVLFKPDLNLRSDDMRFVSHRLSSCRISDTQIKWLCDFLTSSFAMHLKTKLVDQLSIIAADAGAAALARQKSVLQHLGQAAQGHRPASASPGTYGLAGSTSRCQLGR